MWLIILIIICFIINPVFGAVVVGVCLIGYFALKIAGDIFRTTENKKTSQLSTPYKYWKTSTICTCTISLSLNDTIDVCRDTLVQLGHIESVDFEQCTIIARFRSKWGNKVRLIFKPISNNSTRVIALFDKFSTTVRGADRIWYKIVSTVLIKSSHATVNIKVSPDKPKNLGIIEENSEGIKYLYSNGRIKVKEKHAPIFDDNMSGYDYEHFVAKCFRNSGYRNVTVTQKSGDYGADIVMTDSNGVRICVQCKKSVSPVGVQAVQEVIGAMYHYHCSKGTVVTTSTFTPNAKELASEAGIELFENFRTTKEDDLEWIDKIEEFESIIED